MANKIYWNIVLSLYILYCRFKYSDFHEILDYKNPEQFIFTVKIIESLIN